jgi:thiol peroxidase
LAKKEEEVTVATIKFKGIAIHTAGNLPAKGKKAPAFKLVGGDLKDVALDSFGGKIKILNIVPSLDTPVCAISAQRFNAAVASLKNVVLINISADLPFAQKRFCESNSLGNIVTLSTMRSPDFGRDYGVVITDGPLDGLMSRVVLILDSANVVVYSEQVPEIAEEPDYSVALAAVKAIQ